MTKRSAGILVYRAGQSGAEIFLMHPGGPFFAKKDLGSWSIPKGEINEDETEIDAARREFLEETGVTITGKLIPLTPVKQKSGKLVFAWATKQEIDVTKVKSNLFEMEWPPRSGKLKSFPEMDKAEWFTIAEAKIKIIGGQVPLIEELETLI